jgi:hypothetical protein
VDKVPSFPLFEYFRQRGLELPRSSFSCRSLTTPPEQFDYQMSYLAKEVDVCALLRDLARTNRLVADSTVFAPTRCTLVASLLQSVNLSIVRESVAELEELKRFGAQDPAYAALCDLVFPDGASLHAGIQRLGVGDDVQARAATYYVNVLHLRKKALEPFKGTKDGAAAACAAGMVRLPTRTSRLARRGDPDRRFTDEALVVLAVPHAFATGKGVVLLTHDGDVFDQFYKVTSLIRLDFGAHIFAERYAECPETFPQRYELSEVPDLDPLLHDKSRSFAVVRPANVDPLLPEPGGLVGVHVVRPEPGGEVLSWALPRSIGRLLQVKAHTGGRNTDKFDERNVYIDLGPCTPQPRLPRNRSYAFFLVDKHLRSGGRGVQEVEQLGIKILLADAGRALGDVDELDPAIVDEAALRLAARHAAEGRWNEADRLYRHLQRRISRSKSRSSRIRMLRLAFNRAVVMEMKGKLGDALRAYEAVQQQARSATGVGERLTGAGARINAARVWTRLGEFERARKCFREVEAEHGTDPGSPFAFVVSPAVLNLARLQHAEPTLEDPRVAYERVLEHYQGSTDADVESVVAIAWQGLLTLTREDPEARRAVNARMLMWASAGRGVRRTELLRLLGPA